MTEITPEAVQAALDAATPGPWGISPDAEGFVQSVEPDVLFGCGCCGSPNLHEKNADLIAMTPDLATAYIAQAQEIERLRKRVEAADVLAETAWGYRDEWCHETLEDAVIAYRATEEQTDG